MNSTTCATDAKTIFSTTTSHNLDVSAVPQAQTVAHSRMASLLFAVAAMDLLSMKSIKSVTSVLLPNTTTSLLEFVSVALISLLAVTSTMDSSLSVDANLDTLPIHSTPSVTEVVNPTSTMTSPSNNA
jgi:hypothetical protein